MTTSINRRSRWEPGPGARKRPGGRTGACLPQTCSLLGWPPGGEGVGEPSGCWFFSVQTLESKDLGSRSSFILGRTFSVSELWGP